ncbi:M4 family metallopeptidase [Streptomyces sp. NPDC051784]|uniref:M4 family metallopeptidase n=1 Tax=Streptomyces sp. NPDC051784 TaxID=3155805 RepID=UPI003448E66D
MRTTPRRRAARSGRPTGISVGQGVAALLATAGLLVTAVPAAHAATTADSAASSVVPGQETDTPALVTGLDEAASSTASATDAARGHIKAKSSRYHIADADKNLVAAGTESKGGRETVRLQQKYKGVPVLGGQYVVRMDKKDGKRTVTGTSGKYFTQLKLDTVKPKVTEQKAIERAIGAVRSQLGSGPMRKPDAVPGAGKSAKTGATLAGTVEGLTVLPQGEGVLTRHVTVTGTGPDGQPVKQNVYVDAHSGFPLLQYSAIKTFGATTGGTPAGTGATGAPDAVSTAAAQELVVKGTGKRYNGETTEVNLYRGTDGALQTIDYGFRDAATPGSGPMLATYDARGKEAADVSGVWPSDIKTFRPATTELGEDYTDSGAVDAHWAAHQVYDYYKSNFGRKGLDGKDGYIYSLVGVVNGGRPFNNAFWDGQKMVYGQGGGDYRTFSADTDVVGHEMTHGVVEHSAGLVYAGQSGAMNEAIADYFGNAIDLTANHMSMDDPDAALLGEDLCTTTGPRDCALRDLDDGATTSKDFIGVSYRADSGGVHLNSTIFSGALWDIRQDLDPALADKIVYRALTGYMTPLDGFTEGRAAVIAAAEELGVTKAQKKIVKRSFDAHGIVPGWETALGVDTDTLLGKVNVSGTGVGAAGGKYAVSRSNGDGSEPYSVWVGNTDGKGGQTLVSPNNGNYNVYATTDGKKVAWAEYGASSVMFHVRPVGSGVDKVVGGVGTNVSALALDGDYLVYTAMDPYTGMDHVGYINIRTGASGMVDGGRYQFSTALPSVKDGKIAYAKMWPESSGYKLGVEVFDIATGTAKLMPVNKDTAQGVGQTAITDDGVYWVLDQDPTDNYKAAVERSALDGSDHITVLPEAGEGSLYAYSLTASDDAVTVTDLPAATSYANDTLPKLYQTAPDGKGGPRRVSCNRGDQVYPASDTGTRVLWLDGTTGYTNLVKRDRPAGSC